MKKLLTWIMATSLILTLCLGLASCKPTVNPDYVIAADYGISVELNGNYTATVNAVDVKSDESLNLCEMLEANNVVLDDKAWVAYNFTIEPKKGEEVPENDNWVYCVVIPAPIPEEENYVVWRVDEGSVNEVDSTYENESIIINGEYRPDYGYNFNYVVCTEESFNVVEYYETHEAGTIPEHINVGNDTAEDAYQKGQTRTLKVYPCFNGINVLDDEYAANAEGHKWEEYNALGREIYYQQLIHVGAVHTIQDKLIEYDFIGWYIGELDESGSVFLEDDPFSTAVDFEFEMPAEDITLFAVYARTSSFEVRGNLSKISVNGSDFYDYIEATVNSVENTVTLSVQPDENCYFCYWAYADDPYNPDNFISDEPTFVYMSSGYKDVVAVCEPYSKFEYSVYSVCSEPIGDSCGEYRFIVNGEDYNDDYYSGTFWEYQTFRITAVPVKGCKFVGWAVISLRENETYDSCKDKISSTDATYIINKDNCSTFKNNKLVAVYEMLPHHDFDALCYYVEDNNYGSYASIYVNGQSIGDDFYATMLAEGEQVTIKVVPEMNCRFEGWYYYTVDMENFTPIFGDLASADPEFTFTMGKENIGIIAKLRCYPTYSVSAYAGEGGDIYINGVNHYGSIRHAYEEGEKLTVKIDVKEGFEFKGWYNASGVAEELITTDLEFEYTVGSSDANFVARLDPIIYYNIKLEIKSPALTVDIDDNTDLPYVSETEVYRVYVTMRREGASVTIRANDVEGADKEFSHWMINGEMISDREYTFIVGTEDVMIYAVAREKIDELELKCSSNQTCKVVYSTDYETGKRYISTVSVNEGAMITPDARVRLFDGLYIVRHGANGYSQYQNILVQCDIDFGGAATDAGDGAYIFKMPGKYTVTITDKANPELSITFTLQVVGA